MTVYLKPKDYHHDKEAGKRLEGGNEFCHFIESPDKYDAHWQYVRNIKAYFTNSILAGIEIEYLLISQASRNIKNVTFKELGTEVDEQNF